MKKHVLIILGLWLSLAPLFGQTIRINGHKPIIVGSTPVDPMSFTYTVDSVRTTSAGIYTSDDILVKSLWSNVSKTAGSYTVTWDGTDSVGSSASSGSYKAKVLISGVQYLWEGVIGNTSAGQTRTTIHSGLSPISSMVEIGPRKYFGYGYMEGRTCTYYYEANPQSRSQILSTSQPGPPVANLVCADATNVYWGAHDPYEQQFNPGNEHSFVYATTVASNARKTFSSGTPQDLRFGDDVGTNILVSNVTAANCLISGIAVQQSGNYLFVARRSLNQIKVHNKSTGALVQTLTYTTPQGLSIDPITDNLWMITGTTSLARYVVNSDGTLQTASIPITGLTTPLKTAISQDGATIAVIDAGNQQVVKAYSTSTGASSWTLGTVGGYFSNATVTNTKFYFSDTRGTRDVYLCFLSDGSFWLGDGGNNRSLHFNSSRVYQEQIMFQPGLYTSYVDPNTPTRVFAGNMLEFAVDYGVSLSATTGWTLVKNWGANIASGDYDLLVGTMTPVTLSNGRTYCFMTKNGAKDPYKVFELVEGGTTRYTGKDAGAYPLLYANGQQRFMQSGLYKRYNLQSFDGSGNPNYSFPANTWATPAGGGVSNSGSFNNPGEVTSNNIVIAFNGGKGGGFHIGGFRLLTGTWVWKSAKNTAINYTGNYPTDGSYDIGNMITTTGGGGPGSVAMAIENNVFWHYYGEFWKGAGGQVNKFNHLHGDTGLMIGQFGVARNPGVGNSDPLDGMAGNAFKPMVVKVGNVYYMYHNDESFWSGVHRWKIYNLNKISVYTYSLTK